MGPAAASTGHASKGVNASMARPAAGVAKAPATHAVSAPAPLQPAAAVEFEEAPVQSADAVKSVAL